MEDKVPTATTAAKTQEARNAQSQADKVATLDLLKGKKRALSRFKIYVPDETGDGVEVELVYRAIGAGEYDKLVGKHPPTTEQRAEGSTFNIDTFAPALIAAVCIEPEMTYRDAKSIWDSDDWSRGEVVTLWRKALDLCNRGMDVPFTASG
jgi:hypothetical protein